jgi:hypothetical protein
VSIDYFSHGLLHPGERCVRDYIYSTDETEVATYGERLPSMANYIVTNCALDNFALVVDGQTVAAEDGSQLTHHVWLILPVIHDKHRGEVLSAWHKVGREWRKGISGSHVHLANTTHGIHLHE